ncbi:MAG: FG-GAP-like repeat-containing protein, partial [Bacteroidota bacterium]
VDKAWDAVGVIDEPIITSLEVYDITATTVKIKGKMMPRADTANYHFEYGTTPAFGSSTSIKQYTNVVEDTLTGLQSETKYYLRLVATNKNGSTYFTSEFTTISLAPMVKIEQTVDVTENTATLHGQVNPNSLSTSFYFEYGPTPSLGMVTPTYLLSDTTEFLDVSASITGLQSRQTYYFRLVATNASASSATATETLFTASKPIITSYSPVTAPVGAEITIAGQNFNAILSKNLVSFGATRATVLSASSTELKVNVPAGASLGPISLLDAESGLSAESVQEFVPTFTDEFKKGDIQLRVGIADLFIYQTLVQDMDGDNKPDIVARHYPGFSVFLNVNQGGDITAESFVRSTFPVESAGYLYSADLDGNGLKDIVTQYQNGTRIYPNFSVPGFIFFGVPIDVPTGYLGEMKIIDFDQDGHSDLAGLSGNKLMIFRNQNPKGTISATNFELRYTSTLAHYVNFLSAADVNNDGKPDLVVGTYGENSFPILKNNSHPGVFEFEELIFQDNVRGRYARYGAYDLNQDSWKDVISQSPYETGNLAIIENLGASPEITLAMPVMAFSGNEHTAVQPADINGDSKVDLLIGTGNRTMIFLENKAGAGQPLSSSTFQKSDEFGMRVPESHSGDVTARLNINDLNGDGRPEVIAAYSYSYGPHDGYNMEIWQNAPADCPDPSLITLNVSSYLVTIVLPPNKTLDQYQIEYANSGSNYWYPVSSTILYLYSSTSYKLRIRAKCYLGFTEYHYINFQTDCVDTSNFSISNIGSSSATLQAYNLSSIEIQYSLAGKNQWTEVSQYASQISNLLPGTTYDVRFRGRCYMPSEFRYKQFTTLCPKLSSLNIFQLFYNKAVVTWTSNHPGNATLEYSSDNLTWASIDDTGTMAPLVPSKKYFVRGRLACTNSNSDFIYTSFTTPCPKVSSIYIDAVTPFSARVNWVDESGSNNYTLTYAVTAGEKLTTIQTSSTSFNLTGLSPGTQYIVKVAPECSGNKDYTEKIFSTVCYVPFDLSVNAITHTTAELSWSDNFSGVPYVVDYSILGSDVWKTATTTSTKISMIKLRPGTEYEARVHITCMSETAPYVSIRFETSLYGETTLAPNPTAGNVTLYPSKNLIGNRFIIHDNTGRIVASGELLDYNFNLSDLSPGIYTLRIDGNEPLKILKN